MAEDLETTISGQAALARVAHLRADADRIEREAIRAALDATDGSEKNAAALLGITRTAMHALLRRR